MRLFFTFLFVLIAGAIGWYLGSISPLASEPAPETTEAQTIAYASKHVKGLGRLEPVSGIVKIYAPQGQQIETLFDLKVGDPIAEDQPLAQFAGREVRQLELKIAKAKKQDALRQWELEKSKAQHKRESAKIAVQQAQSLDEKIESKSAQIELLKSQKQIAELELQRLKNIASNPTTSKMVGDTDLKKQELQLRQIELKIQESETESKLAKQEASRAEKAAQSDLATVNLLIEQGDKAVPLRSLDAGIEAAEKALELTELKSPIGGTILDIILQPGETVTNQPVMAIGDTGKMVCVTEINDVNFRFVDVGDKATISSVALDGELTGRVVSKGIMIGPPSMKDPNPFASVDRETGRVVVELDDSDAAADFINLQVDVEIEISDRSEAKK